MAKASKYPKSQNVHLFNAWCNMRRRCSDPTGKDAANYHDRGINYDDSWNSWSQFCEDMASTYVAGLSLDRVDNNKGYSKANCRWATRTQQNNNTRANRLFTIHGETKTLAEWCRLSKYKPSNVRQKFYVTKVSIEVALGFTDKKERIAP